MLGMAEREGFEPTTNTNLLKNQYLPATLSLHVTCALSLVSYWLRRFSLVAGLHRDQTDTKGLVVHRGRPYLVSFRQACATKEIRRSGGDIRRLSKVLPVVPGHPSGGRLRQLAGMPQ